MRRGAAPPRFSLSAACNTLLLLLSQVHCPLPSSAATTPCFPVSPARAFRRRRSRGRTRSSDISRVSRAPKVAASARDSSACFRPHHVGPDGSVPLPGRAAESRRAPARFRRPASTLSVRHTACHAMHREFHRFLPIDYTRTTLVASLCHAMREYERS